MIRKYAFLACDRCAEEFDAFASYAVEVREVAAERGWVTNRHGSGFDVCDECRQVLAGRHDFTSFGGAASLDVTPHSDAAQPVEAPLTGRSES